MSNFNIPKSHQLEDKNILRCTFNSTPPSCKISGSNMIFKNRPLAFKSTKHMHKDWEIDFTSCIMLKIPAANLLLSHAPNLTSLSICFSSLKNVCKEDLEGFGCLKNLRLASNQIESLPGDLFEHTPNLHSVDLKFNGIKYIGPLILEPLKNLTYFNLMGNVTINSVYSLASQGPNTLTLDQMKLRIKNQCSPPAPSNKDQLIKDLTSLCSRQQAQLSDMTKMIDKLTKKLEQCKTRAALGPCDFTVLIDEKEFKVHKVILRSNSSILAKLFDDDSEMNTLQLEHISKKSFEEVYDFMMDKIEPSRDSNLIEIYNACHQLEINQLTKIVVKLLSEKVDPDSAYDVLMLCNNYEGLDDLKKKAFIEFQKNFQNRVLPDEFASNPEILKKLWDSKLELDNLVVTQMKLAD